MTVRELIEKLDKEDPDRLVVLSQDRRYGFSPLCQIESAVYADGEIGLEKLTPELEKQGYGEEDVIEGQKAIVLFPG